MVTRSTGTRSGRSKRAMALAWTLVEDVGGLETEGVKRVWASRLGGHGRRLGGSAGEEARGDEPPGTPGAAESGERDMEDRGSVLSWRWRVVLRERCWAERS